MEDHQKSGFKREGTGDEEFDSAYYHEDTLEAKWKTQRSPEKEVQGENGNLKVIS